MASFAGRHFFYHPFQCTLSSKEYLFCFATVSSHTAWEQHLGNRPVGLGLPHSNHACACIKSRIVRLFATTA